VKPSIRKLLLCLVVGVSACGSNPAKPVTPPSSINNATVGSTAWPSDWHPLLGQQVTVDGIAANAKLGATLLHDGASIWIDGVESWPEGFYRGGSDGQMLRVTGTVIERNDLPAFVKDASKPEMQGIPVANEAEAAKQSHRYLLKDATWIKL
jgi:hypothetical protein